MQFFYPLKETERKEKIRYFLHNEIDENAVVFIDNFNANSSEDKFIEILANARCNIVCTSRTAEYKHFTPIVIEFLSVEECILLYEKYAKIKRPTDEKEYEKIRNIIELIVKKVGRHTLTIEILGKIAYCEELLPKEVLEQLDAKGVDMEGIAEMDLGEDTLIGHLANIFSVDKLDAEKKYILAHFANCPLEQIPKAIKKWIGLSNNYYIKYLIKYGWFIENEESYYMHPIIKETVKRNCSLEYKDYLSLLNNLSKLSMYDRNVGIKKALPYYSYMQSILKHPLS